MYIFFIIYIIVASIIVGLFLSKRVRKYFTIIVIGATIFALILTLHGAAKSEELFTTVEGTITRVAPEYIEYPALIVTVETFDGNVYTYYAEEEIDINGTVTLLLFLDEVIDVF